MTSLPNLAHSPDEFFNASDFGIEALSHVLKACGDTLRIQILQVLQRNTYGVLELTQLFNTKQSGMSHHLKVLFNAGLVETQREGNAIFYRRPLLNQALKDDEATRALFDLIDRFPLSPDMAARTALIRQQRAVQSQTFFTRLGDQFRVQQELICDYEQYAKASFDLLIRNVDTRALTALEIGPGDGAFLKHLSSAYRQVYALDNSAAMLDTAKTFAQKERLANLAFLLGDTTQFRAQGIKTDAIVMNMVLHHIPSPADVFVDVFDILNDDGVFVICDLSHHDQEWAKANCGDLWLGFESQELSNWARSSGLTEDDSVYIGLRNGFQIQLRRFSKSPKPHI